MRGGREYLTGEECDEVETEESFARATLSLASRRSFTFRARWTSSSNLGSGVKTLVQVYSYKDVSHLRALRERNGECRKSGRTRFGTHTTHTRQRTHRAPARQTKTRHYPQPNAPCQL